MTTRPSPTPGVASPCTQVCRIDPVTGWCEGCRRSLDEIAAWSAMDDTQKKAVWAKLAARGTSPPALTGDGDRPPGG